jgi:regulator of telomere elongation helicase 1
MKAVGKRVEGKVKAKSENGIILSNRKPAASMPSSPPTMIELRGITVHFPFKPYKCQEEYMNKVLDALHHSENALLESPTGTGKTLCLLCSALAWQREQSRSIHTNRHEHASQDQSSYSEVPRKPSRSPVIIYASRTHSQLSQVIRELKSTRYRPRHALLGSREQMCVNPKVKTPQSTVTDINHDCNRLGKDRKCGYRNNLDGFQPEANEPGAFGTQPIMDMEDLILMGNTRKVCPFYYTRSVVQDAELILVPYNYLFDKDARETTLQDIPWSNSVVIFDEAHNLESFASDSASFDLTSLDISCCISEVQRVIGYQQAMPEISDRISADNLIRMKAILLEFENYILTRIPNEPSVFSGEFMMSIFKEGARITYENHVLFVNEAKKVSDIIMDLRSGSSKGQTKIDFLICCIKRVFGETTEGRCFAKSRAYRVHVASVVPGNAIKGRTISYWCFAPSLAMQELSDLNIRSMIVTSGTLSPLPSYSLELGVSFPHTLENPHIISDEQIHVRVIGTGVSGKQLCSTFNRREDAEYLEELGSTIINLARVVPDGMLIFFPSYGVMSNCIEQWGGPTAKKRNSTSTNSDGMKSFFAKRVNTQSGSNTFSFAHTPNFYGSSTPQNIWKRLLSQKAIVLEPKTTSDLNIAISEFHKYLNYKNSSGCILMGVCRGKISEGIDFSHHMCRAVLITGLPFAPYLDPKVKLKREYLDEIRAFQKIKPTGDGGFNGDDSLTVASSDNCLSGIEWYTQQAHRAVNQAIGRVIRNKYDYGAVLLLDSRFGEPKNRDGLSLWVRSRVLPNEKFGVVVSALGKFFREAKAKALELEAQRAGESILVQKPESKLKNNVELDNESLGLLTNNIAVVKSSSDVNELRVNNDESFDISEDSYIRQDQVLGTMNLVDLKSKREGIITHNESERQMPQRTRIGLAALYEQKQSATTESKGSMNQQTVLSAKNATGAKDNSTLADCKEKKESESSRSPQASAQEFFVSAKKLLSEADFSCLRTLLVEMKNFGDGKDIVAYMKAARSLVTILIKYFKTENDDVEWEKSLLYLFFPLLPKVYAPEVQKLALKIQLEDSDFIKVCNQHLPPSDHRTFYNSVYTSLKMVLCITSKQTIAKSEFLRSCVPVITYLYKKGLSNVMHQRETSMRLGLSDLFCFLVPPKLRLNVKALFREIESAEATSQLKSIEKQSVGERSVDVSCFLPTSRMLPNTQHLKDSKDTSDLENQRSMQTALIMAEQVNSAKRNRVQLELEKERNPMEKHPHITGMQPNRGESPSSRQAKTEKSHPRSSESKKIPNDRVSKLLRRAASSPFSSEKVKVKIRENEIGSVCVVCKQLCHEVRAKSYFRLCPMLTNYSRRNV